MEGRKFDINVVSAKNLPDIRNLGRMKVYAEVSINGKSETAKKISVDKQNKCNPVWKSTMTFTIAEHLVRKLGGIDIVIKLYCERTFGDRYIGEVKLPINSLFESGPSAENIDHPVRGTLNGILTISYKFGDRSRIQKPPSGWNKKIDIISSIGLRVMISETSTLITGAIHHVGGDFDSDVHSTDDGGPHHSGSASNIGNPLVETITGLIDFLAEVN